MRGPKTKRGGLFGALALCAALLVPAGPASAAAAPKLQLNVLANTNAQAGSTVHFMVEAINLGNAPTSEPFTLEARFPEGIEPLESTSLLSFAEGFPAAPCAVDGLAKTISCTATGPIEHHRNNGGDEAFATFTAEASGASGTPVVEFEVSGGGADPASALKPLHISDDAAPFGIEALDGLFADAEGDQFTQAGGHPQTLSTSLKFNTETNPALPPGGSFFPAAQDGFPIEPVRDVAVDLPIGLAGDTTPLGHCTAAQFGNSSSQEWFPLCPPSSQVGTVMVELASFGIGTRVIALGPIPVFNMAPPTGAPARFGFKVLGNSVLLDARLRQDGSYGIAIDSRGISEGLAVMGTTVTFWGVPGDKSHDAERSCVGGLEPSRGGPTCTAGANPTALLRMPTSCTQPGHGLSWRARLDSWFHPGGFEQNGEPKSDSNWRSSGYESHDPPVYPQALPGEGGPARGTAGCDIVPVKGKLSATPTAIDTETSSGLNVHVEVPNPGLENPAGIASSDIEGVKVALPQGMTINPSQAEGLGVCSPARYASTELSFFPTPGKGCPEDSKIGSVEVETPLLAETLPGDVYIAQQDDPSTTQHGAENPFDSLLAIYIVLHEPQRGILVKLAGEVSTDPTSGQILTEFRDLPQVPFSTFDFHFREGARAPLVTPPTCGTYTTEAEFTPWSDPSRRLESDSSFQIVHGIGGGPCPSGGIPPFHPGFSAGAINNNAGAYSPFDMRLTRSDGEQDMTRFSAVLPPGVLGKLAGVGKCPDSAIAIAKAKTGRQEQASPSCPASSQIGRSLVGAGVGSVLTYVPGEIYLGGPFHGDPLSVIAITPAVAGPFDVGTVVVHQALTLNPKTAEVEVDGSASDPIPHILKGIPAKLRDIRVYVDRDKFTLNPTSCDPSATDATLFGSAADVFNPADDVPVSLSDRFQAASCSSLGFKPKLALNLKGGTRRGAHPGLTATYTPRSGDANVKGLVVTLPRSAFLDQGHIRTICTRVQFAAKSCPKGARYGFVKAWSPLLDEPLEGPVYLRSSNHKLPDLVFDLHGLVDVEVATRIDSFHGGIRASVEDAPDAPLTKVLLKMQGAKKGLIVNSRNLCGGTNRASVESEGQNGKEFEAKPELKPQCGGKRKKRR